MLTIPTFSHCIRQSMSLSFKILALTSCSSHLCWDLPHLKGSSAALLSFRDLDTRGWPDSRAPATCNLTNSVTRRTVRLHCVRRHVPRSSLFSHQHKGTSLLHWYSLSQSLPPSDLLLQMCSHHMTLLGSSALFDKKSRISREVTFA